MQYQIRAMRVGEILDTGINLVKNHFGLLFGIMALSVIPVTLVTEFLRINLVGDPETIARTGQAASPGAVIVIGLVGIINGLVIAPLANAASIYAISSFYLGKPVSLGEAFSHAVSRWAALIGTSILMGLAIIGGLILLIIPGIIFAFWFSLAQHVAVLENRSGAAALGRSKALMKGNIGSVFVLGLLIGVIGFGVGLVVGLIPQVHAQVVVLSLIQGVLGMFAAACMVVFYFSCRCKYENFDMEMLAAAVEEN